MEKLVLRPNVPLTHCGMCGRKHGPDTQRLTVQFEQGGKLGEATILPVVYVRARARAAGGDRERRD